MKLFDFLKLCNPYMSCLILNTSIKDYICNEVETIGFILENFDLSNFVVINVCIDTYEVNDEDDCIVNAPYLSISIEEI